VNSKALLDCLYAMALPGEAAKALSPRQHGQKGGQHFLVYSLGVIGSLLNGKGGFHPSVELQHL